jgi:hypothetical protein
VWIAVAVLVGLLIGEQLVRRRMLRNRQTCR